MAFAVEELYEEASLGGVSGNSLMAEDGKEEDLVEMIELNFRPC